MFAINQSTFFSDFEPRTGLKLTESRQSALTELLTNLGADNGFTMVRELAYVLATIRWETMHTFAPIKELRWDRAKFPKARDAQDRYWNTGFYGRGYVQITWEENYRRAGEQLKGTTLTIDGADLTVTETTFTDNPDFVLNPEAAYAIASRGMREGWFTGKKLGDYIKEGEAPDYVGARKIINGIDHNQDIATMANHFELLLRASIS